MRCDKCKKLLRLQHKVIEVDTLVKHYICRNGHKSIYRRYGHVIELNGKKIMTNEAFNLSEANRQAAKKRRIRNLLPKTTFDQEI